MCIRDRFNSHLFRGNDTPVSTGLNTHIYTDVYKRQYLYCGVQKSCFDNSVHDLDCHSLLASLYRFVYFFCTYFNFIRNMRSLLVITRCSNDQ